MIEPVKFRCKTDQWRQYRGYVFEFGRPTTVRDRASIEEMDKHPDFERVADVAPVEAAPVEAAPVIIRRKPGRPSHKSYKESPL